MADSSDHRPYRSKCSILIYLPKNLYYNKPLLPKSQVLSYWVLEPSGEGILYSATHLLGSLLYGLSGYQKIHRRSLLYPNLFRLNSYLGVCLGDVKGDPLVTRLGRNDC